MKTKLLVITLLVLAIAGASTAWAGGYTNAVVNVTMTAQISTGDATVTPQPPGNSDNVNQWFYYVQVTSGSFNIHFPVQVCSTETDGTTPQGATFSGYPVTVEFHNKGNGGSLGQDNYTLPGPFVLTGSCVTGDIVVDTTAANGGAGLLPGDYSLNKELSNTDDPGHTNVNLTGHGIHIHIRVVNEQAPLTCMITDSDFNPLLDCHGNPLTPGSSGDDGDFIIVTNNKGIEVATNPGQFYYNMLYTNLSGTTQNVTVTLQPNGINLNGANSVHYWVFSPADSGATLANFNFVNTSGVPNGKALTVPTTGTIAVGANQTLWVDMHLVWPGLGAKPPVPLVSFSNACGQTASAGFSVVGTVNFQDGTTAACTASADGYGK